MLSSRFDQTNTNRFPCYRFVMPEVDLRDCHFVRIELRCNMRIESNRIVPQMNRLSLGVLDRDENVTDL